MGLTRIPCVPLPVPPAVTHALLVILPIVFATLLLAPSPALAQGATGRIEGIVTGADARPTPAAIVRVLGTTLETRTGPGGFYRLTFVPVGRHTVRIEAPGANVAEVTDVTVHGDGTTQLDIRLAPGGHEGTPEAGIGRAPVGRPVSGADVDRLPVSDPLDALLLRAGASTGRDGALVLRGARPGEAVLVVDGVPVRPFDSGNVPITLPPNALAEAAVHTGGLGAEWGEGTAGVLSLTTGRPTGRLQGSLSYETDGLQGSGTRLGLQWLEASLGARPLPHLTLFAAAVSTAHQAAERNAGIEKLPVYTYGEPDTVLATPVVPGDPLTDTIPFSIPEIVQYGGICADSIAWECHGRRRPRAWESDARWVAKARYDLPGGSHITLSGLGSARQDIDWRSTMNQDGRPGTRSAAGVLTLDWVQRLPRGLTLLTTLSRQANTTVSGAVTDQVDLRAGTASPVNALQPPDFVVDFDRFVPSDSVGGLRRDSIGGGWLLSALESDEEWDAAIENERYGRGTRRPYLGRDDLDPASVRFLNPYGVAATYPLTGLDFGQTLAAEHRTLARVALDRQARRLGVRVGFERTWGRVGHWEADWTTLAGGTIYTATPSRTGAFLTASADLGGPRVEAGIRADWFNSGVSQPLIPGRTFTNPAFDADSSMDALTCEVDICDAARHVWIAPRTHATVSPSVHVMVPLGQHTTLRLSAAGAAQSPPLAIVAAGSNNDVSVAGEGGLFGGDVAPSRSMTYEAAAQRRSSGGVTLDAAVYFRDVRDQWAYRFRPTHDPVLDSVIARARATNQDFGDVRGLEVAVRKRWGEWLTVHAAYSLTQARSTGSDFADYVFGIAQLVPAEGVDTTPPPDVPLRTRDVRLHELSGTLVAVLPETAMRAPLGRALLGGFGVFATFRVASGLPYTRLRNAASGVRSDWTALERAEAPWGILTYTAPWERTLDLRVSKPFTAGGATLEVYGDFRNLLGLVNTPVLFAETGSDVNGAHRTTLVAEQMAALELFGRSTGVWAVDRTTDQESGALRAVEGLDLRSLAAACGTCGAERRAGLVMLERTERRFGNGDGFYEVAEQESAVQAWYDSMFGAPHFAGPGRSARVGVQVRF